MRLLIITQKVDRADPILGFFHGWLQEFSRHCTSVTVIGQLVGDYALPPNVHVISLGKEKGVPRAVQILKFWWTIVSQRKKYDCVLVHMTPIWVVLGAPLWRLLRKRMYLWYEARGATTTLKRALCSAEKVFSASTSGMPVETSKSRKVGHGIDTTRFLPGGEREKGLLVAVGRITKAKRYDIILRALSQLPSAVHLTIAGVAITKEDERTSAILQEMIQRDTSLQRRVTMASFSQEELLSQLQRADVFVHSSETSLDKAVLEAMACGVPVVSTASAFADVLPEECLADEQSLAEKIDVLLQLSDQERRVLGSTLRDIIEAEHGLHRLVEWLMREMKNEGNEKNEKQ